MLLRRSFKLVGFGAATLGSMFAVDHYYYYSTLIRSFRTFWVAGSVALDYKLNFRASMSKLNGTYGNPRFCFESHSHSTDLSNIDLNNHDNNNNNNHNNNHDAAPRLTPIPVDDSIERLHTRTAHKIYNLCRKNGGLYIKFGQQMCVAILFHFTCFFFLYQFSFIALSFERSHVLAPLSLSSHPPT
jgi:hypothetical protein